MFSIGTDTALGQRLATRLRDEHVVWLTTISPRGAPQPTPVWFLWNGDELVISSQPGAAKLRNLAANPVATVHFNTDVDGDDVQVLRGRARVDPDGLTASERAAYDAKYADDIVRIQQTSETLHAAYSVVIRFTPTGVRGY